MPCLIYLLFTLHWTVLQDIIILLFHKVQKKSASVTLIGKFEFRKVPFGLAQTTTHFKQLINQIVKGLSFVFRYLDDIVVFSETLRNTLSI